MPDQEWGYPDGGKFTEHEDGSFTVTDPSGAKTHVDPATGRKTETPAPNPDGSPGGPPTGSDPRPGYPREEDGEIEIRFNDGTRIYIRRNPKRFRIRRSNQRPVKWEVDLPAGTRRIQDVKDGPIRETPPTEGSPREISPSEHPRKETPKGGTPGGSKSGKPKRKKASPKKSRSKPRPKKKKAPRRRR